MFAMVMKQLLCSQSDDEEAKSAVAKKAANTGPKLGSSFS